ncbi:hypothetical protein [Candidatus Scalindua japonica]|uniref:hypothetical protein n=1 Tax=Candidatus Scalindua japonica TaxID=1284222 RepID=UPI001E53569B|nr:hypothetical protein [Candidatus Scalindua japonica]
MASRVLFWRWSRSILSSRLERTEAMAFCSGRGGRRISKFSISDGFYEGYAEVDPSAIASNISTISVEVR